MDDKVRCWDINANWVGWFVAESMALWAVERSVGYSVEWFVVFLVQLLLVDQPVILPVKWAQSAMRRLVQSRHRSLSLL